MFMERSTTQSNMAYQRQFGLAPILRSNSGKPFLLEFNMKTIPLTQGKFAIVDDEDYEELSKYKWFVINRRHSYAVRNSYGRHRHRIYMHREVIGMPSSDNGPVDHINHNGLDNRKCNLRICSNNQNRQNSRKQKKIASSKYKGVCWHKGSIYKGLRQRGFWSAHIGQNKKQIYLGVFKTEVDAADAYDRKAKELFGDFAYLNNK
jgi:hypothetical protein